MTNKYKIGDTITAKFSNAYGEELVVTGVIREFRGDMICCNQVETNKSFRCLPHEIIPAPYRLDGKSFKVPLKKKKN